MTVETLVSDLMTAIFGNGAVLGAAVFIFFAFVAFRTGIPLSGMIFLGVLLLGALVVFGIVDIVVFGVVLIIGALVFWRSVVATGG